MANLKQLWMAAIGMALASCAPPKAVVVEDAPAPVKREAPRQIAATEPTPPVLQDDGLRMPDLLELPGEGEFRSSNPTAGRTGADAGPVISRPPTDPPSRVKPPEEPAE